MLFKCTFEKTHISFYSLNCINGIGECAFLNDEVLTSKKHPPQARATVRFFNPVELLQLTLKKP